MIKEPTESDSFIRRNERSSSVNVIYNRQKLNQDNATAPLETTVDVPPAEPVRAEPKTSQRKFDYYEERRNFFNMNTTYTGDGPHLQKTDIIEDDQAVVRPQSTARSVYVNHDTTIEDLMSNANVNFKFSKNFIV